MSKRIESPSSISTYQQCPKKYWYRYVKKLPGKSTIDTTRGNIVHEVLEKFFLLDWSHSSYDTCRDEFKKKTEELLVETWKKEKYQEEMKTYPLLEAQRLFYFEESLRMLLNWIDKFAKEVYKLRKVVPFPKGFSFLAPQYTEREYTSEKWRLCGKIDAVHKINGEIIVKDYKTSKRDEIDNKLKMQAAIYSLLYLTTHHRPPDKVCFDFLKLKPVYIDVSKDMVNAAIVEIRAFHRATRGTDEKDYPIKPSYLCKWRTGQCDFYDICNPPIRRYP